MTIDVEEWFQVENLKSAISRSEWETCDSSVTKNINIILDIFKEYDVRSTFFILGWLADRNPIIVKKIFDHGHEVASHGYGHSVISELNDSQLYDDIKKSKQILEKLIQNPIRGYRAPNFSVNDNVIDILKDLNFNYDSSYNPFQIHSRYGSLEKYYIKDANITKLSNGIYEIPISSIKIGGMNFPIGGGAYFRLLPYFLFKNLALRKASQDNLYNFYIHPWEFEPNQPRIKGIGLSHHLRHYSGLNKTVYRLKKLIKAFKQNNFSFLTIKDYLNIYLNISS